MERYEKYKDSGIDWIGEIPEHWEVSRLKNICQVRQGLQIPISKRSLSPNNNSLPYITIKSINNPNDTKEYIYNPPSNVICKEEDVLVARTGATGEIITNICGVFHNNFFLVDYSREKVDKKFLIYFLQSSLIKQYLLLVAGTTTIPDLNHGDFYSTPFLLISLQEQKAIACYLDRKTAEIDQLIAQKERLIKLYEEEKTAIIDRAVTKGINPDVELKSSGIVWLGDIPEHWEIEPIKYSLEALVDCEHKTAPFVQSSDYFVVRTSNVRNGKLLLDNAKFTTEEGYQMWTRRGIPRPGDVLLTREAPAGEACLVPEGIKVCLGQRMVWLKIDRKHLIPEFIISLIYSSLVRTYIDFLSAGSTVAHFNMSDIQNIPIVSAPLEEQKAIARYIETECDRIDAKIAKTKRIIELQKEYRTALISEAVTGKIKVPELAT